MFENKTFETILDEMLTYVNNRYPELDINTGSIIYTALAPIAMELETAYHNMSMIMDETFIETASKEYLVKFGDQVGVPLHEATYGRFIGEFNVEVEIGARFNCDKFNYSVVSKLADPSDENPYFFYELVCETAGSEPTAYVGNLGTLTPISYVGGLGYAKLVDVLQGGEDEEDTESYRYRIQTHVKRPVMSGNISQYEEWLDEFDGVGKYKITPCWNGANTIKLLVLNEDNLPDELLAHQVQEVIDPRDPSSEGVLDFIETYPQGRGMGNGYAPIGAIVSVVTAKGVNMDVVCGIDAKPGYSTEAVKRDVEKAIRDHLASIALEKTSVEYMPIYVAVSNVSSVGRINTLVVTINGQDMDFSETPFVSSVELEGWGTPTERRVAILNTLTASVVEVTE